MYHRMFGTILNSQTKNGLPCSAMWDRGLYALWGKMEFLLFRIVIASLLAILVK